jgi:hypothetical protein
MELRGLTRPADSSMVLPRDVLGKVKSGWVQFRNLVKTIGPVLLGAYFAGAGAGGGASGGGASAGGSAAAAEGASVTFDYSYLDALEAGDAFYGNEAYVSAASSAAASTAAPGFWDKALDAGTELAKKYAAAEIASRFAPDPAQRDISSRVQPAGGVPLVRYSGQPGDALGTLLSPAALKALLTLGVVGLVGALAWRVAKK